MTADEIEKQQARLAAAKPFAELSEVAAAMREHLSSVENGAGKVAHAILNDWHGNALESGLTTVQEHVLDDYAQLRDELHAAVDRVMRSPLLDRPRAQPKDVPPDGPLEETPMAKGER